MVDGLLQTHYNKLCSVESNMVEHMPTLRRYAELVDSVVEFGVCNGRSTTALLAGCPKQMVSYDLVPKWECITNLYELALEAHIPWKFVKGDTREISIMETDLLFIDTDHTYTQLKQELRLHSNKVKRFIILHDTVTNGTVGSDGTEGMQRAIDEFLESKGWQVKEVFENCHGLMVLERGVAWKV